MTPQEFLGGILPTSGRFCIVGIDKERDRAKVVHRYSTTVEQAAKDVDYFVQNKYNVYYATAGMGAKDSRTAQNTVSKRELYIDVDCGADKPYKNPEEGSAALKKFLQDTGLPKPTVVFSGNGLHAHWFFEESIDCLSWYPVAARLKAVCAERGFAVDPTVMADFTRILRIPETQNLRGGATVKLLNGIKYFKFEDLKAIIGEDKVDIFAQAKRLQGKSELDESTKALMGNRISLFSKIIDISLEGRGCAQVRHAVENSHLLNEPLWRANLSIAQVCEDRDWAIHEVSKDHSGYDPAETERKAEQTQGPYRCESFQRMDMASLCNGCIHAGKISSPVQLGVEIARAPEQQEIVEEADNGEEKIYQIPKLPYPYFQGRNGGIYRPAEKKLGKKEEDFGDAEEIVYPRDIYVFNRMIDPDRGEIAWIRVHTARDGVKEFPIALSSIATIDKLREEAANNGVITYGLEQTRSLQYFFLRMMEELQYSHKAEVMHARFGWTDDDSFIVGDRNYRPDGVYHSPPSVSLRHLVGMMDVRGNLESWKAVINSYNKPGLEMQAFAFFTAFGAPLMKRTSEGGCLVNLFSNGSGTGKTTAQHAANSVFGHPKKLMLQPKDTENAKIHRMGTMCHMVVTLDEVTNWTAEEVSDMSYSSTAMRAKNRMSSQVNTERVNQTEWCTIMLSSSNSSLVDKLKSLKEDPQGEMARVLELYVDTLDDTDRDSSKALFDSVFSNYGVAGDIYLKYITTDPGEVDRVNKETADVLQKMFAFTGPERYHSNTIIQTFTGAVIAKQLGLHDISIGRVIKAIFSQYRQNRTVAKESKIDPESMLSNFINENRLSVLVIDDKMVKGVPTIPRIEPRGSLLIRWEPDTDILYISATSLNRWTTKNQVSMKEIVTNMKQRYDIDIVLTKKRLGKGTALDIGGSRVYAIPYAKEKLGIELHEPAAV